MCAARHCNFDGTCGCFLEIVRELGYMPRERVEDLSALVDQIIGNLFGLVRTGVHTKA